MSVNYDRDTDLTIRKGDYVVLLDKNMKGKWTGLLNQKKVFFPPWVVSKSESSSPHETSSNAAPKKTSKEEDSKSAATRSRSLLDLADQAKGLDVQTSLSETDAAARIESPPTSAVMKGSGNSAPNQPQSGNFPETVDGKPDDAASNGSKGNNTTDTDSDLHHASSDPCASETLATPPRSKSSMSSGKDQPNTGIRGHAKRVVIDSSGNDVYAQNSGPKKKSKV